MALTTISASKCVDDEFIKTWYPKYLEIERLKGEYEKLVRNAASELSGGTLTWDTFERIIHWKSPRTKGKLQRDNPSRYLDAIRNCHAASDFDGKLKVLLTLPGIGVPVASTLLHFFYPSAYPIIDRRTVAVLHHFGHIRHKSIDVDKYRRFRDCILGIQNLYPLWNLRKIDMALFAYHKHNPQLFGGRLTSCR